MTGLLDFSWWVYAVASITVFLSCLSLNFVLKLYNDARLHATSGTIYNRNPVSQSTQVHGTSIEVETRNAPQLPVVPEKDASQITQEYSLIIKKNTDHLIQKPSLTASKDRQDNINDGITLKIEDDTSNEKDIDLLVKPSEAVNPIVDVVSVKSSFLGTIYSKNASETGKADVDYKQNSDANTLKSFTSLKNFSTPRHGSETVCYVAANSPEENLDHHNIVDKILGTLLAKVYESKTVSIASLQHIISQNDVVKVESILSTSGETLDSGNQSKAINKTVSNDRGANAAISRTSVKKINMAQSDSSIH